MPECFGYAEQLLVTAVEVENYHTQLQQPGDC